VRPRVDEQLEGVRRLLEVVATEEGLSAASAAALVGASRALRRLELSWSGLLPFLLADNQATAEVLDDVADVLPADLSAEVRTAVANTPTCPDPGVFDVAVADDCNVALRGLLARAVTALPSTEEGDAARHRVAAHLRRRLDADPTSGRSARGRSEP
jgi:hypothetical protein